MSVLKPAFQFTYTVTVRLTKASAGPRADPDYLAEEIREALEEAGDQSVYSDEDVEYEASCGAVLASPVTP